MKHIWKSYRCTQTIFNTWLGCKQCLENEIDYNFAISTLQPLYNTLCTKCEFYIVSCSPHISQCESHKLQIAQIAKCKLQPVICTLQFAQIVQCTLHKLQIAHCAKCTNQLEARRQQSVLTNQQLALRQLRSAANKLKSG